MRSSQMRDEILAALERGLQIALDNPKRALQGVPEEPRALTEAEIRAFLRERANNIAQMYADRTADETKEI